MKKLLIGICGIGNGHINRQSCVISELMKNNDTSILIATQKEKIGVLSEKFPKIKIIEINIPWISCNEKGIDYYDSLKKYNNNNIDQFKKFLEFSIEVEKYFKGKPDIVISDYEPNVAQYAYSSSIPLICMEQQAKFLYLDEINIKNNSIKEEKYRINYFFPKFNKRIISSFFPISIKNDDITITTPIISKIIRTNIEESKIIVYFSPYSDSEDYISILNVIKHIKEYNFYIYSKNKDIYEKKFKYDNLFFYDFDNSFKESLSNAAALLTTGGHQLISEAISINLPILVFPLNTYEQKYNALMVEKYELGRYARNISKKIIIKFLKNIDIYSKNIICFKKKHYLNSWEKEIDTIINNIIKNKE